MRVGIPDFSVPGLMRLNKPKNAVNVLSVLGVLGVLNTYTPISLKSTQPPRNALGGLSGSVLPRRYKRCGYCTTRVYSAGVCTTRVYTQGVCTWDWSGWSSRSSKRAAILW
jgi:hypothetical protein